MAATEERERLARELHDAVTQTLFSASLIAEAIPLQLQYEAEAAMENLEKVRRLTRGALAEMRMLLLELRPTALVEANLEDLLRQLAEAVTVRHEVDITIEADAKQRPKLPPEVQLSFYRIAQEAFNNITKHANAEQVDVRLVSDVDKVKLTIQDDGSGFDPNAIPPGHFGVAIMHERAAAIGASLRVGSRPGHGAQIAVEWRQERIPVQ